MNKVWVIQYRYSDFFPIGIIDGVIEREDDFYTLVEVSTGYFWQCNKDEVFTTKQQAVDFAIKILKEKLNAVRSAYSQLWNTVHAYNYQAPHISMNRKLF